MDLQAERQQELITGLAGELAAVVSALLGSNAAAVACRDLPAPGWDGQLLAGRPPERPPDGRHR